MKRWIAYVLGLVFCLLLLSSCDYSMGALGGFSLQYDDAALYQAGGTSISDAVVDIHVHWINGKVDVRYHDGHDIRFFETSDTELSEATELHYMVRDGELVIQYAKSGLRTEVELTKELTLLLPHSFDGGTDNFYELSFDTVNADVTVDQIIAESCEFDSVSSSIKAHFLTEMESLSLETVSGNADITVGYLGEFEVESVSGNISVHLSDYSPIIPKAEIKTVSGGVTMELPEDASVTIEFQTLSGTLVSDFETEVSGHVYTIGTGLALYEVETVSGNVHFVKVK